MKILIAYDGSECADSAIADLANAGLPADADAEVVSVAEAWLPPPPISSYDLVGSEDVAESVASHEHARQWQTDSAEVARSLAHEAGQRIKSMFPGWRINAHGCFGSPSTEVLSRAEEWSADLIVAGSHGRSLIGRLILGSVSNRVLSEAHCSVRVARGKPGRTQSPIRILVCVDGSAGADAAVASAASRYWPAGTEATVLIVCDPVTPTAVGSLLPPVTSWAAAFNDEQKADAEKTIQPSVARLQSAGVAVTGIVRIGDPRWVILKEAEELNIDSLFVGARGLSRIERFLLGSVSSAVASRAHCSVEVVRG